MLQSHKRAGLPTYAFFQDIRKAFDTADHNAMLLNLHRRAFQGNLWHVVSNLYRKVCARVKPNGCLSETYHVDQEVAQGCPLSPLPHNIFTDDLLCRHHAASGPDMVQLFLRAEAYADDLLCVADSQASLQLLIDVCYAHSHE